MTLPNGLTYIGKGCFQGLKIKKLSIPASVQTIEKNAFQKSDLEEVIILGKTTLGSSIFKQCTKLTSVTLPEGITDIPSQAFFECSSLATMNIPGSVVNVGTNAFYGCNSLTISQLTVKGNISLNSFSNLNIKNLDIYTNVTQCAFLSASIQNVTIHEGVTSIGNDVFERAYIGSITLPSTLTSVGSYAFYGTTINKVVFTSAVTLGHSAFKGSTIKEITLPAGSILKNYVFCDCSSLETIRYGGTKQQWLAMIQWPNYSSNYSDYEELNNTTIICSDGTI